MAQAQTVADLKDTGVTVAPEAVVNEILPFCAQGQEGRDLLPQAEYAQDIQRNIGHQRGIARAQLANKQARQVSHMAAGLAQFLARRYAPGVVDDGDLDKVEAALVGALDAIIRSPTHLATLLKAGLVWPDGVTTTVDDAGLLSALGGNLLLNSETTLTESGTWKAPVGGWYDVTLIAGGNGGMYTTQYISAGSSGEVLRKLLYFEAGEEVTVTVGAGGLTTKANGDNARKGGDTLFGPLIAHGGEGSAAGSDVWRSRYANTVGGAQLVGGGDGGGYSSMPPVSQVAADYHVPYNDGRHYGAGGGAGAEVRSGEGPLYVGLGKGAPGAVILRWHDPAKAAGPLPAPALLSARRMAPRAAAAPATVNLYDPETGQGSIWREADAKARLAEGLISQEAWLAICAEKAAEARAEWLASPDTVEERFEMLRQARDARLAATDYLVAPDYPLTDGQRSAVTSYRQALRDLPAQECAPWDGGGEATPWPEPPAVTKVREA